MNRTRLRSIFLKEFTQMRRDRATLGLLLGIPVYYAFKSRSTRG